MKIIDLLVKGFRRSLKAWKGVLIITLALLILSSLFAIPFKSVLKAGFGSSMISEELLKGFNPDLVGDLTENTGNILSYFSSGFLLIILTGLIFHSFFSGGLFSYLRKDLDRFTPGCFLKRSAEYFLPFLFITLIISIIIIFISVFIIVFIAGIRFVSDSWPDSILLIITILSLSLLILIISFFLLVADFTRSYYIEAGKPAFFTALASGFRLTFNGLSHSVFMMVILILMQILPGWMVAGIILKWNPVTGLTIFLMFLFLQILSFTRIFLRSWRYASVTVLMQSSAERMKITSAA